MLTRESSTPAKPQRDGDPGQVYDLGDMFDVDFSDPRHFGIDAEGPGVVKRLVHTEKSGPAFYRPSQPPIPSDIQFAATGQPSVEDMLVQSLQSQAVRITGETLNALRRCCLLDLCKCWPRLLKVVNVTSLGARAYLRQSWEWTEMREAVELALCYAEHPASIHWQRADALIRGYAMSAAMAIESRIDSSDPNFTMLTFNAASYRSLAEGRS